MYTPDELERITFDVVWRGYDEREVDDLIDEIVVNLRSGRPGLAGLNPLFSAALRGYDQDQVDAMLDRVAAASGGPARPSVDTPEAPQPQQIPPPTSAVVEPKKRGWFRR